MTKPTLILIPGLLCDGIVWQAVVERLEGEFDLHVADLSKGDNLTRMAEGLLAQHPGNMLVAGHSMGARVAMEMARIAPNRVRSMALLDTGMHPLKDGEPARRQEIVDFAHREGMRALAARWLPGMVNEARHSDTALIAELTAMVERMDADLHERQIKALVDRPDASSYIATLQCPVLLVVGRQDQWSPVSQHEDMLHLLPNAELRIVEDAGHFAPVEQPEVVADILAEWAEQAA